MIIRKIELRNIRSHEHYIFEPAQDGLTVISGVNGAGKSTIINAFAWSLFGAKGQSKTLAKDYVREGVNPKETYVGVTSFIVVGNREYKIERRILSEKGGTQCNIFSRPVNSEEQYNLDCGPGVSHSEAFMKNLLGFDETGFYSSSFIQQKQVDAIVSAGPRERATIIEKMIGVKSITEAITLAREESRALQKSLSIIQTGSVEEQEQKVEQQKQLVIQLAKKLEEDSTHLASIKSQLEEVSVRYNQEKEKQQTLSKLKQEELILTNDKKNLNERLENQLTLLNSYPKSDYTLSESVLKQAQYETKKEEQAYLQLSNEVALAASKLRELDKLFSVHIPEDTFTKYTKLNTQQEECVARVEMLEREMLIANKEINLAKAYLRELKEGVAQCPYCHAPVTDVEEEVRKHSDSLRQMENTYKANMQEVKEKRERSNKLLSEIVALQEALDILSNQVAMKEEYTKLKSAAQQKEQALSIHKKTLGKRQEHLRQLLSLKDQIKAITTTKETIKLINSNILATSKELEENKKKQESLDAMPSQTFKSLELDYLQRVKDTSKKEVLLVNTQKDLDIAKVQGRAYLDELKSQRRAALEYAKVSHQLTVLNSSIKTLTAFKELRTKTSIPSLSSIATDILSRFTDGAFTRFILDERFETFVETNTGQVRSVNALSGGEESAAAIALRLAIALFLSEGTQSLLVLDEILASMDSHRQQLILEAIKELTNAQVILVAHSEVANTFSDKLVILNDM